MVKQKKPTLNSSRASSNPTNTPRRGAYYRLLLDEAGSAPRKSMLPDSVAEPFRELLFWLANLTDDPRDYLAFWGRHHWWRNVFLKEAAGEPKELLRLRDQLRNLWNPNVLPAQSWLNYHVQTQRIAAKGIRKIYSREESQKILDKAESRIPEDLSRISPDQRRLLAIHIAVEMGEIPLEQGQTADFYAGKIFVREGPGVSLRAIVSHAWTVAEWVESASGPNTVGPMFLWRQGIILPDPFNLRVMLALAVADNSKRFAKCNNPSCPEPYFLKKRKTQKYCEQGECTAYIQRKYSLDWWERVGKDRRKRKQQRKKRKT